MHREWGWLAARLLPEHFQDNENHDSAEETAAEYHVKQRPSSGRHGRQGEGESE